MTSLPKARFIYSDRETNASLLWTTPFLAPEALIFRNSRNVQQAPGILNRKHNILKTSHIVTVELWLRRPGYGRSPLGRH